MIEEITVKNLIVGDENYINCTLPDICPRCHRGTCAHVIGGAYYLSEGKDPKATIQFYCQLCKSCFITTYDVYSLKDNRGHIDLSAYEGGISEPVSYVGKNFPSYIVNLSPKFVQIYHQSENAEATKLDQIAGMGYRKALEFLVKDYAIHKNPNDKDRIESMSLSNCIKTFIDNPKIKTLAERSTWLGNDETHYVKKHMNKDTSDLRKFINACANYIEMELTLEDAESITK